MVVREPNGLCISTYGMITDQVIINRLVPAGEASWRWAHASRPCCGCVSIFSPCLWPLPWFEEEMIGLPRLGHCPDPLRWG